MSKKSRRRNKKILGALAAIGLGLAAKNKRNKAIDTGIQSAKDDSGSDMMEFKEQVVYTPKVVTTKNIVHAALWLVLVLAGVAGQFLLLGAEFIGVTQILVYIGAVIVLLLFGVMLTKASIGDEENINMPNKAIPAVIATLMFGVMSYSIIDTFRGEKLPTETVTNAAMVSDSIFSDFIIPFEAVSVLLLAALIGAVVIARKEAA